MTNLNLRPNITRVQDSSGFIGTVLYVGPVASAKSPEIYAGISWDDVTRGKHDGSVICRTTNQLIRHFKCGPTQGSFLRLSKVDTGVELTPELMRSRYVKPDAELIAPGNLLPHVARTSSGREKPIEFWGEVKIRGRQQLEVVEEISLRMLGISGPCGVEERREMEESFGHIKGIDLAGNLLSDWQDVFEIMRQFPSLESVSLASNRINDLGLVVAAEFPRIRALNLNNCNVGSFKSVRLIGQSMPQLEELCLAHANLADIENCISTESSSTELESFFQNLVLLDLSDCRLTSWELQILPFGALPKLESLILNDNAIEFISITGDIIETEQSAFPALASLQLAGNPIAKWTSLDDLNKINSLRSLRLRNTPLTESLGVGEVRSTAIARFPNLEYFNASPISERERLEAERRYVSTVARELLLISSEALLSGNANQSSADDQNDEKPIDPKQAQVYARHPRFQALVSKHKDTMMALTISDSTNSGKIGEDIINITIRSMAAGSCDVPPLQKRLPRSLQVGRIKAMCARAFGLEVEMQVLHFRVEGDPFPSELDDADHSLAYYGVTDGAEILVNEIDVEAQERETARRAEDHTRRIKEQEQHISIVQSMQKHDHRIASVAADMVQK